MAAQSFVPHAQSYQPAVTSPNTYSMSSLSLKFDRDATGSLGSRTPYHNAPLTAAAAIIRGLPLNTSEESLRLMMVFSKELVNVEMLPAEQSEDPGFRSAILKFRSLDGAQEAKNILDGKPNISNDAKMIVEILGESPASSARLPMETSLAAAAAASTTASSTASSATSSRQASRFNDAFQSMEGSTTTIGSFYGPSDLGGSEAAHYQKLYSPQAPIGNHLSDRPRISGKTLINNDAADDDETGELLKDPVAYAENGALGGQQRRATAPQIPISRMAGLSLNTTAPPMPPASMPLYSHHALSMNGMSNPMSPSVMAVPPPPHHYNSRMRQTLPPANPADQNPPCNTLYVGNLPNETSEEELKAIFSKQRGYKRLCFRTKQNGPMCFVEFEDVSFATKALKDLYGQLLHNSQKGGIRLSFSKNPLGVRSPPAHGQNSAVNMATMNGGLSMSGNGFTSVTGPPPGITVPPGLNGRLGYSGHAGFSDFSNVWGGYSPASMTASASAGFPPNSMGR
ncbi:hypothetical protein VTK73DRAFT_2753 [Phialemonium thermophilum]|uniref:RRM domain-containing protein n=1 Tax=Phialemonium thermophilum TaxID=223376 RepID=A0ABR3Y1C2_9PEZI